MELQPPPLLLGCLASQYAAALVCYPLQLWKVKKALKMTVTWSGLRPKFQVRP